MISIMSLFGRWGVPLFQVVTVFLLALLVDMAWEGSGRATLYGGIVSIANLLWLQWRLQRTERKVPQSEIERDPELSAKKSVAYLYMASIERFILVSSLFLFGMVRLELDPLSLIAGFIMGQLVLLFGSNGYSYVGGRARK